MTAFSNELVYFWPTGTDRLSLERTVSDFSIMDVVRYRWKLMDAAVTYDPFKDKTSHKRTDWRRSVLNAYMDSCASYPTTLKALTDIHIYAKEVVSVGRYREIAASVDRDKTIFDILTRDSRLLVYEDIYYGFLHMVMEHISGLIISSPDTADKLLDDLYLHRCILPYSQYFIMKAIIDTKILYDNGKDNTNPNVLYSRGEEIRRDALSQLVLCRDYASNVDQWYYTLYKLAPLFKMSAWYFLSAAKAFQIDGRKGMMEDAFREEYSSDEFAAEAFSGASSFGLTYIGVIDDLVKSFERGGIKSCRQTLLYHYKGLFRLTKFMHTALSDFLEDMPTKNISRHTLFTGITDCLADHLNEEGFALLLEALKEYDKKVMGYPIETLKQVENGEKRMLNSIGCPACEGPLDIELTKNESEIREGRFGFVRCIACSKQYPIEFGIVMWGHSCPASPYPLVSLREE